MRGPVLLRSRQRLFGAHRERGEGRPLRSAPLPLGLFSRSCPGDANVSLSQGAFPWRRAAVFVFFLAFPLLGPDGPGRAGWAPLASSAGGTASAALLDAVL